MGNSIDCIVDSRSAICEGEVADLGAQCLWSRDIPVGCVQITDAASGKTGTPALAEPLAFLAPRNEGPGRNITHGFPSPCNNGVGDDNPDTLYMTAPAATARQIPTSRRQTG